MRRKLYGSKQLAPNGILKVTAGQSVPHLKPRSDVRRKKVFNITGGKDDLSNGLAYSGGEATFYVWIILAFAYEGRYYSFMDRENKWEFSAFYSDITKHNGECT